MAGKVQTFIPDFTNLNNLAAAEVGGRILFATDDWFAVAENLLKSEPAEWREGVFTSYGKWMDGWESRRKRTPGHDWCIIKLGVPGIIEGFDVDTSYFTGNYPPQVSIQAASLSDDVEFPERVSEMGICATDDQIEQMNKIKSEDWTVILPMSPLKPGYQETAHNYFKVNNRMRCTHLRLNYYPDGGTARLRVYGYAVRDWSKISPHKVIDLAAMVNGGRALAWSNQHYGHPRNLIAPGRAPNMGNGWETARRLDRPPILKLKDDGCIHFPGSDWAVLKLGHPGLIKKIEVDTNHFKGNFPDSCIIEGCTMTEHLENEFCKNPETTMLPWRLLLPSTKLSPHKCHFFTETIQDCGVITHVKLTIFPDGGVSRLRLIGLPRQPSDQHVMAGL